MNELDDKDIFVTNSTKTHSLTFLLYLFIIIYYCCYFLGVEFSISYSHNCEGYWGHIYRIVGRMVAPYMMFLTFLSACGYFCSLLALLGATYKPINVHYCTSQV
jgi:hypothetical protein